MQLVLIYSRLYICVYIFRMFAFFYFLSLFVIIPPRPPAPILHEHKLYTESYLAPVGLRKETTVYEALLIFRRHVCHVLVRINKNRKRKQQNKIKTVGEIPTRIQKHLRLCHSKPGDIQSNSSWGRIIHIYS